MGATNKRSTIAGIAAYVPDTVLKNAHLEKMVDTTDDWIVQRTGIRERRILDKDKPVSYIGKKAVTELLKKTNTAAEEIELVVCGTNTSDMPFPSTASKIAYDMGCHRSAAFDVQAACPGFLYSLIIGSQFIETGYYKKVIVLGIDKMSSCVDYADRRTCVLFGDGGGAALLVPTEDPNIGIIDSCMYTDGSGLDNLCLPGGGSLYPTSEETIKTSKHYMHQNGIKVFKQAVACMTESSKNIMKRNGLTTDTINWLIPHQANLRIITSIIQQIKIDPKKVFTNVRNYGNTSAGSIPLCLWENEKRLKKGDKIIITSFGAGYTWCSLYLIWGYNN